MTILHRVAEIIRDLIIVGVLSESDKISYNKRGGSVTLKVEFSGPYSEIKPIKEKTNEIREALDDEFCGNSMKVNRTDNSVVFDFYIN